MKKIIGLIFGIFFLVLLVGCRAESAVVVTFSDVEIGQTSISLWIRVEDPDQEITGAIVAKIIKEDEIIDVINVVLEEEFFNLNFTYLENGVTYDIEIHATMGRDSVIIESETYTTLSTETIHITTPEEFLGMDSNRLGNYVLDNDLDFSNIEFTPPFSSSSSFSGTFDGQNHTISNATFDSIVTYTGIFGYVSSGLIKNLTLDNIQIGTESAPLEKTTSARVGFLAGYVSSSSATIKNITITNSEMYFSTSSTIQTYVGAVVGELRGNLSQVNISDVNISLRGVSYGNIKLGGAVGLLTDDATLKEVNVDAQLTFYMMGNAIKNKDILINIGGVVGDNHAIGISKSVENIASSSDIDVNLDFGTAASTTSGNYAVYVGGIIGFSSTSISNSFYNGSISVSHEKNDNETEVDKSFFVGGLIGYYGSLYKTNAQVVRLGNGNTIDIDVSDDVYLVAFQTLGGTNTTVDQLIGIYGDQYLMINGVSEVAGDSSTLYTDLDDYFTQDWIQNEFDLVNIPG